MELLEGETLKVRLEGGAIVERKAVEIAAQMARGLGAAHEKQIVHRDLKPDNVMIGGFGEVYVVDWGIAVTLRDGRWLILLTFPAGCNQVSDSF